MSKKTTKTVKVKDLKRNLFVRASLNHAHAGMLAELLKNDVKLPPIKIAPDFEVIDGRHRVEAHELNGLMEIEAEIVHVKDRADMIAQAFKANAEGPLPPTEQDTEHTVMLLLDSGASQKSIAEMLRLPMAITRRYIGQIKSKMSRAKLQLAADAVRDEGLTVPKAAEKVGVDVDKLREHLGGKGRRQSDISDVKRVLTSKAKSYSMQINKSLKKLVEQYEDGDVGKPQVVAVVKHIKKQQKLSARWIADWERRFSAAVPKGENAQAKSA